MAGLKVIKSDGVEENYLHTKVVGTINKILCNDGYCDLNRAEQLAEVVTYYVYDRSRKNIRSGEIFSIIVAVLSSTGYEREAELLSEHYFGRKLKRMRTEVVFVDFNDMTDTDQLSGGFADQVSSRWDKSKIVEDLVKEYGVDIKTARMISGQVEEKVFSMKISRVPSSLLLQLVLNEAAVMLNAERELDAI